MTEAVADNTGEVDEHLARQVEISQLLQKRAPLVCPGVVPRAFKEVVAGVQVFLASDAGRLAAAAAAAPSATERSEEGTEKEEEVTVDGDDGGRHVVLTTETDIATRTFRITGAKFGEKTDAVLSNLELLMDLHLNASEEELEPYVARFTLANELDISDRSPALALQEVCSLAYTLQVAASNIPGWTGFVGSLQLPLADGVDMTVVGRELCKPPTPPPSPPSKSASGKKGKKGKSKSTKKKKAASPAGAAGAGAEPGAKERGGKGAARGSKRKK